ncbi:MAG: LysR substrate-binding domain-containing protein [Alphaproteobacteria bacterium]|nr:LysR substrate-binding domain-containing protein [Alphaproteobacteria bacterium]
MAIRLPSLNALRAFETVARVGSVSQAADELNVTAGAVSRLIKALEDDLGLRLLERDGRGVRPTPAAQRAIPQLSAGFRHLADAAEVLRIGVRERPLALSVEPVFASGWLVSRLNGFRAIAPSIDLRIDATNVVPDARRASTDIAILYGEARQTGLDAVKLIDEDIFPVCSPDILKTGPAITTLTDLLSHTLLHYDDAPEDWYWPSWPDWFSMIGEPRIEATRGLRMVAGTSIMDAARGGQGIALACTSIAMDDLASGRLVRPVPDAITTQTGYVMATKPSDQDRADIAAFRQWLLETIRTA